MGWENRRLRRSWNGRFNSRGVVVDNGRLAEPNLPPCRVGAMERRNERRVKRRITCEFFHEARAYKGFVLDLDDSGLFIRTNAVIKTGEEIDIHLAASAGGPAMSLRAEVSRRRAVPASLRTLIHPGLGVRILEAPREYGLLTGAGLLDEPIQKELESGSADDAKANTGTRAVSSTGASSSEEHDAQRQPPPPQPEPARPRGIVRDALNDHRVPSGRFAVESDWSRVGGRLGGAAKPDLPLRTTAVLVGGDDLDAIAELLADIEVETLRCGPKDPQLAALRDARLLVVSATLAISDPIPVDEGVIGIAICEDVSETIRSLMRQKGFQYLVRRPVHPDALRLLLRYALYQKPDRRGRIRHPIGYEVSWRIGWQRDRGALLEISTDGCTLLATSSLPLDTRIAIRIPREVAGGESLKLRGTVIRCTAEEVPGKHERTVVAVALEDVTARTRERLIELCERWAEGPPKLPDSGSLESVGAESKPGGEACRVASSSSATEFGEAEPTSSSEERRGTRRGVFNREIVEVDAEGRAVQGLLARDLSPGGLRVDPQFGLGPGDKLQLALFDTSQREPLIVTAVVARDDGEAGLGLHFVDLSPETKTRIDDIVASLPAVESLGTDGNSGGVLAGILSRED